MTDDLAPRRMCRTPLLRAAWALALLVLLHGASGAAEPFHTRFVSIALHDVVDRTAELDDDAVTSDRLVAFFDWLRGNGWHAISLDDVARAQRGEKSLPAKAVLISVDDGYRSLYTRVYPLLLAYRVPVVAALVGEWMAAAPGTTLRYGELEVARERFVSWEQAREMQRSGLVEFALHSHALHREVPGNPQGNTMPAAVTRRYAAVSGYESEAAFVQHVRDDLARGRDLLLRELGRAPRTLVWPYGRYDAHGVREARAVGFTHLLTLDSGVADARRPLAINRYLPTHNPSLSDLVLSLRPDRSDVRVARFACLNPATLWSGDAAQDDARLGRVIERIRTLGLTGVVVDALQRDAQGRAVAAWFPNRELPLAGDLLSRIAWQLQTRAGVAVHVRLAHRDAVAALGGDATRALRLYNDLGALVPLSGWVMEGTALPATAPELDEPPALSVETGGSARDAAAWWLREQRQARLPQLQATGDADALAWRAFASLEAARPGLRLLWWVGSDAAAPHPLADFSLAPQSVDTASDRITPPDARLTRWFTAAEPPDASRLAAAALAQQRQGGVAFGWCPDDALADRPLASEVAPAVSASTFPARR